MKHTTVLTDKHGDLSTIIFAVLTGVSYDCEEREVQWDVAGSADRLVAQYKTDTEARAAFDELNTELEAWHGRNDPPVMLPLDPPRPLGHADYRYEVIVDWGFSAHGTEHDKGAVIDYDKSQSESWIKYLVDDVIKRVPK